MAYTKGSQSNILKDFSVSIDGIKLTNGQINEIKIKWNVDGFKVSGILSFTDLTGLIEELPIRGRNDVILSMTDFDDVVSSQAFKVVEVRTSRETSSPFVELDLIDPISLKAMQTYNEMSFKSEDMVSIIDNKETIGEELVGKEKDFCETSKHKNFVMPLHVSFNVVMHWLAKNADVLMFQTRKDFVIQTISELFSREQKGDIFLLKTPNQQYRRNIYQFKLIMGKEFSTSVLQPNGKVASFDPNNKHSKFTENNYEASIANIEENTNFGLVVDEKANTGAKYFYKSDYHIEETTANQWSKNSYKGVQLELLVPGQFGTNIGDIVKVEIDNWLLQSTPEKNMSGMWMVTEIIDVINPPDFIQRLTLSRSKYFR